VLSGEGAERNNNKAVKIWSAFKFGDSRLRSGSANNYYDKFCYAPCAFGEESVDIVKEIYGKTHNKGYVRIA
jgi:hypothetical protein